MATQPNNDVQQPQTASMQSAVGSNSGRFRVDADQGQGTQELRSLCQETLATYPPHYQAALRSLQQVAPGRGWECYGAMETALSEVGMEITFDFRQPLPDWRRLLLAVTMANGAVTNVTYRELAAGEHSGIEALDRPDTDGPLV